MKEIEFSTMNLVPRAGIEDTFFDGFITKHQAKVKRLSIDWGEAWNQLVRFGLSSQGPDVSEVGTTWVGGLHSMDALRPFTPSDIASLGGAEPFRSAVWESCYVGRDNLMLAIPFVLDMRVLLYRRDWLEKAGVDEATAFIDSDHFSDTIRRIKAAGHPSPLGIPTSQSHARLIHDMASWVWSAGGELRSSEGSRMMLMEPQSRAGMRAYFALNEFISPEMQALAEPALFDAFFAGTCAVVILPERSYLQIVANRADVSAEVVDNVGMAMLMQVPYIGGSAFSIWRYSNNYADALKLIQYLTSLEAWKILNQQPVPFTPARLDALAQAPLASTPFYSAIKKTIQNGRSFQSGFRWSAVESRLVAVIQQFWDDLRVNPDLNIDREIEARFLPVCNRLEQTILVSS